MLSNGGERERGRIRVRDDKESERARSGGSKSLREGEEMEGRRDGASEGRRELGREKA